MTDKLVLHIKKRTLPQWITMFIIVMPLFLQALVQFFGIPGIIKYTIDIAWITISIFMFSLKGLKLHRKIMPFVLFIVLFSCYCLITYFFKYQSIFYFLWGFRNNFRFYFAFLAIVLFLESDDIEFIFKLIDVLFVINLFVSLYQFFVLGYVKDFCGGIFGIETGSNASTLLLFSIVVAKSLLKYMNGKENALICLAKCAISLFVSSLAELKFFYIIFVIILIMASLLTKFTVKKLAVILGAALLVSMSGALFEAVLGDELSINSLLKFLTYESYATSEDVGRLTAIPRISQTILTTWPSKLFGMGLGNCDTSSFAICNTPFFQSHTSMNYIWFSSACWFLETGFIGLFAYLSFFVTCFVKGLKLIKHKSEDPYVRLSIIMAFLCVLITFYNSSLRTEIGFLAFFILALPFIRERQN